MEYFIKYMRLFAAYTLLAAKYEEIASLALLANKNTDNATRLAEFYKNKCDELIQLQTEKYRIESSHGSLWTDGHGKVVRVDLDECDECKKGGNTKYGARIVSFAISKYVNDWGTPPPSVIDILDLEWTFDDGLVYVPSCLVKQRVESPCLELEEIG